MGARPDAHVTITGGRRGATRPRGAASPARVTACAPRFASRWKAASQLIVGGSRKSIVYNDLEPAEKLKVYDRGIVIRTPDERCRAQVSYRIGDIWCPHLEQVEPLQTLVQHFADCVERGCRPLSDGLFGLRIVRLLETAQASLRQGGARLTIPPLAEEAPAQRAA